MLNVPGRLTAVEGRCSAKRLPCPAKQDSMSAALQRVECANPTSEGPGHAEHKHYMHRLADLAAKSRCQFCRHVRVTRSGGWWLKQLDAPLHAHFGVRLLHVPDVRAPPGRSEVVVEEGARLCAWHLPGRINHPAIGEQSHFSSWCLEPDDARCYNGVSNFVAPRTEAQILFHCARNVMLIHGRLAGHCKRSVQQP